MSRISNKSEKRECQHWPLGLADGTGKECNAHLPLGNEMYGTKYSWQEEIRLGSPQVVAQVEFLE